MKYIDFHCDTITELHDHPEKGSLLKNSLYIDLEKLKKGGCFIQDFALWVDRKETPDVWKGMRICWALSEGKWKPGTVSSAPSAAGRICGKRRKRER